MEPLKRGEGVVFENVSPFKRTAFGNPHGRYPIVPAEYVRPAELGVRGALVAGWLLMAWYGLSLVTLLLAFEEVKTAAYGVGVVALVALGGALVVYAWALPAALADFKGEGRRGAAVRDKVTG